MRKGCLRHVTREPRAPRRADKPPSARDPHTRYRPHQSPRLSQALRHTLIGTGLHGSTLSKPPEGGLASAQLDDAACVKAIVVPGVLGVVARALLAGVYERLRKVEEVPLEGRERLKVGQFVEVPVCPLLDGASCTCTLQRRRFRRAGE